jgi:L-threonylcarbamoyladenylate synthase
VPYDPADMTIIRLNDTSLQHALHRTVETVLKGGIAAFPTETFYGLGVRYDDTGALARLYELKRRPRSKAMPLIIGTPDELDVIVSSFTGIEETIMSALWPGPLTLLMPSRPGLSEFITGGTGRVAVRVPGNSFALDLARSVAIPITATSANISGMAPARQANAVFRSFGEELDIIVDGGETPGGLPSTIVEVAGGTVRIVRRGVVTDDAIRAALTGRRGFSAVEEDV